MDNITNWLLEDGEPQIKYRTLVEFEGIPKDDNRVNKVLESLLEGKVFNDTMSKFDSKSKWDHINAFMTLAEFGITKDDVELDVFVGRISKKLNLGMKCAKILLLRNLVALGYYEHPWVKEQILMSFENIRDDGTVRCLDKGKKSNDSKLKDMGCYRQMTTYLLLAAELKKSGVTLPQFDLLIDFYLRHEVLFHDSDSEQMIIKEFGNTFFPIDHVHIGLQSVMYGLSVLGCGNDIRCQKAWDILESYKSVSGKYVLNDSFEEPYFQVGTVGEGNKWITLYTEMAKKYSNL